MNDHERIEQRLSAVERTVVDGDGLVDELTDLESIADRLDGLEARVERHERRIASLEGSIDAVGGFVGNVESVNEDVEKQADAAIAAVDRLEYRLDELERRVDSSADEGFADAGPAKSHDAISTKPVLGNETKARTSADTERETEPERTERRARSKMAADGAGPSDELAEPERRVETLLEGTVDVPAATNADGECDVEPAPPRSASAESPASGEVTDESAGLLAAVRSKFP